MAVALRNLFAPALWVVVLCMLCPATADEEDKFKDVTDLFKVEIDRNQPGSCYPHTKEDINKLGEEVGQLLIAAIEAWADYESDSETKPQAKTLLDVIFQSPEEAERDTIKKRIKAVGSWVQNGGEVNNGQTSTTPLLLCGDSYVIRQSLDSPVYDRQGNEKKKADGSTLLIRDSPSMMVDLEKTEDEIGEDAYPYWSSLLKEYFFDRSYGSVTDYVCADQKVFAYTNYFNDPPFTVLCERTWQRPALGSVKARPVSSEFFVNDEAPQGAQPIKDVMPKGGVLFHEMFHLVLGKKMDPKPAEAYAFAVAAGKKKMKRGKTFKKKQTLKNPESYTYLAVAYDYTKRETYMKKPVEFDTGFCVYNKNAKDRSIF